MRTREVIAKTKKFIDFYGFDLVDTTNLRNKEDCYQRLESHRYWLELTLCDAMKHLDEFERKLGLL